MKRLRKWKLKKTLDQEGGLIAMRFSITGAKQQTSAEERRRGRGS
jgi:hypothetical protein